MSTIDMVVSSHENPKGEIMQLFFDCIAINYLTQKCTIVFVLRFSNVAKASENSDQKTARTI